jgi:hypothetical protein
MGLKASVLVKQMLTAARGELDDKWPEVRRYAETEAKKLAQTIVMIEKLKAEGKISRNQAKILLDMQKNTSRVILLTIEGLSLLTAEAAVNAAVKSIRDTVNSAIGWRLI